MLEYKFQPLGVSLERAEFIFGGYFLKINQGIKGVERAEYLFFLNSKNPLNLNIMKNLILFSIIVIFLSSCTKEIIVSSEQNPMALYDEFWNHVNENYIFFDEKNVDWNEVYKTYSPTISENTSEEELLQAMEHSLLELRDGHNLIRTPFRESKVYNFREHYEIHFSPELVAEKYIDGDLINHGSFNYGNIDNSTIYLHVPKMENIKGLKHLVRDLITDETKNLIIDVRNNGGGNSNDVPNWMGDFVTEKTLLGSYIEKTGPNREDESLPIPIYAIPSTDYHFDIQVFVLINRRGYSATSYLAGMVKHLPNFTLVGQITGGGGGGNAGFELSNGWALAISVSDFIDAEGQSIEVGVSPEIAIENTAMDIENGQDRMLEKVLELSN